MGDTDSDSSNSLHTIEDSEMEDPHSHINRAFNYIDWDSSPNIIKAILVDDVDAVRKLLKKPNAIDARDQLNNSPLHLAYVHENLEIINILVTHPDVNLESKNYEGETPLLKSIGKTSDEVIIKLLDAGCDLSTRDSVGRTPLHVALNFQRTVVEELLKRGADLNEPCGCGGAALFHAINISSLELVCMLLYYNADISIKNESNSSPFLHSLDSQVEYKIAFELFPYVVDFSITDSEGLNCLSLAAYNSHPIVMDILEVIDYESLNQVDLEGNSALYYSLPYDNISLFKELFSRMDHYILLKCQTPFLQSMFSFNPFNQTNWVECFYLLASSEVFPKLMNIFLIHLDTNKLTLFTILLNKSGFDKISQDDREKIIYIFLSFGAKVSCEDIINYYNLFGPCNEINIFLSFKICGDVPLTTSPFLSYIFAQEVRRPYSDLKKAIIAEINQSTSKNLVNILHYFTFPFMNTYEFIQNESINIYELGQKELQVPSLLELCRNEVRFNIRSVFGIITTNEFYEIVEKLKIPKKMKNLILFKTPLC